MKTNIEQSIENAEEGIPDRLKSNSEFGIPETLAWIKHFFDYLGGSREEPPVGASFLTSIWWLGLWWGLLAGAILLFCGQTSKFIYIDF